MGDYLGLVPGTGQDGRYQEEDASHED